MLTPEQQQLIDTRYPGRSPRDVLRWRVVRALAEAGGSLPAGFLAGAIGMNHPSALDGLLDNWCDVVRTGQDIRLGVALQEQLGLSVPAWRPRSPAELQAIFARCRNARLILPCEVGE